MASSLIIAGLALAAAGYTGRYLARHGKTLSASLPSLASVNSQYYRGGFDAKMNRREASLILGVSPTANKNKVREAHRRIMLLNHPDRGGSPYIAAKINEAKDMMDAANKK